MECAAWWAVWRWHTRLQFCPVFGRLIVVILSLWVTGAIGDWWRIGILSCGYVLRSINASCGGGVVNPKVVNQKHRQNRDPAQKNPAFSMFFSCHVEPFPRLRDA